MLFQLPQGGHGPDRKFRFCFLNFVQPQTAQVDGGAHAAPAQPQPQHTAHNAVAPPLIQLPGLLQALRPDIFLYGNHRKCSFSVDLHILTSIV